MKRICLFAAISLIAIGAFATDYRDPLFQLSLPDTFGPPTKATATASGIETDTWVAKAPGGEAVVVSMSRMPSKIADPAKLMDSTRDSLLKSVKGTLESEQNLPGATPSRLLIFRSGTAFLRSQLIVDGDRLYQLLYVGRTEQERNDAAVARMFESFRINNQPMISNATPPAPGTVKATTSVTTTTTTVGATTTATTTTQPPR